MARLSFTAKLLDCAEADDRGFNINMLLRLIYCSKSIKHILTVYSNGFYDTISTFDEDSYCFLKQIGLIIKNFFEYYIVDELSRFKRLLTLLMRLRKDTPKCRNN